MKVLREFRDIVIVLVVGGLVIVGLVGGYCMFSSLRDRGARVELLSFHSMLHLGQGVNDVNEVYASKRWKKLDLADSADSQLWLVRTPLRCDADNWLLFLQFDQGKLAAICVRFHDTSQAWPVDAPPDQILHGVALDTRLLIKWRH